MPDTSVVLFTRDLRVHDNSVLRLAAEQGPVVPLFVFDASMADSGFLAPNRTRFLIECLTDLDAALTERGAGLVTRSGDIVEQVCTVATQVDARQVHVAADVSEYARQRTERLRSALHEQRCELLVHDGVITAVAPGEILPSGGDHMAVFTPYHRRWLDSVTRRPVAAPRNLQMPALATGTIPAASTLCSGPTSRQLPAGGESRARERLKAWSQQVDRYAQENDVMASAGTSRLSPDLHFGCLSAAEVVYRIGAGSAGAEAFVRQVAWRDFHHQVLAARPQSAWQDYRDRGDRWREDSLALTLWKEGRTGYPIVDAGMRQLLAEGWMHNRARLIVGSFLTKTLYLDWRAGAAHFLHWLVDGDIANNQMNWQWIAGTGTDTRPNHVLNPLRQADRYDPDGDYVRRYVSELTDVAGAAVHTPWQLPAKQRPNRYPDPMIDLAEGRARFLETRAQAKMAP